MQMCMYKSAGITNSQSPVLTRTWTFTNVWNWLRGHWNWKMARAGKVSVKYQAVYVTFEVLVEWLNMQILITPHLHSESLPAERFHRKTTPPSSHKRRRNGGGLYLIYVDIKSDDAVIDVLRLFRFLWLNCVYSRLTASLEREARESARQFEKRPTLEERAKFKISFFPLLPPPIITPPIERWQIRVTHTHHTFRHTQSPFSARPTRELEWKTQSRE